MARLFVSLSSRDNICALALQNWPNANGRDRGDAFIDLHGCSAGERWYDTLRKVNASCGDVIFLAPPDALDSVECQKELELFEAPAKKAMSARSAARSQFRSVTISTSHPPLAAHSKRGRAAAWTM